MFRSRNLICKLRLRLRLLMILIPASDWVQHKFAANCLNGRNLNVRAIEVQLDSAANTKLLGIKIDNCFSITVSNIKKPLQAAGSIFGGLRRSASQSLHISEGRGAKSIVLNQGLYYIKRP